MTTTILVSLAIVFGAISWIYSAVFLALVAENQRFWKVHRDSTTPLAHTYARACIIIPCKGLEHKLRDNLTGFMRQDHPNYEIFFVVERGTDPAVKLIQNLQQENRCVQSRLIIAGRAENCGQKVHNIRQATKQLSHEIDVLVFADSDANPEKTWLRWLVNGVGRENLGARTGYRWMMPLKNNFPTLVVCTINNALASMLGRGKHYLVWGGSWAIHRKVFEAIGIREAWYGVLSDDLVASRAIQRANLEIEFEPQCVCSSRVSYTTSEMLEFLRRQFLIGRRHSPKYWYGALFLVAGSLIGFWASIALGVWGVATGSSLGFWGLLSGSLLYLMGVLRAGIRQNIGKRTFHQWRQFRKARKFDMFAGPVTATMTLVSLIQSMFGNEIIWRGIRYFIGGGGRVLILGRAMPAGDWIVDTTEAPKPADVPATRIEPTPVHQAAMNAEPAFHEDGPRHIIPFPSSAGQANSPGNSTPKTA